MTNEKMSLLTKQKIAEALKEIIEEKSFSKITVTELIHKCKIKDHMEAVGHKEAFDYVRGFVAKNVPISERVIKEIRCRVLADKKNDRGVYCRILGRIVGIQHEPVQPYLIEPKMEQLLHDYAESNEHIVTKLARFHVEFEGIHPFIDGTAERADCSSIWN